MEEAGCSQLKGVFRRSVGRGRWEHGRGLRTTLRYDGGWWWSIQAFLLFLHLLYTRHEVERITLMLDQRCVIHTATIQSLEHVHFVHAPVGGSQAFLPLCLPPLSSLSCDLVPLLHLFHPSTLVSWILVVPLQVPERDSDLEAGTNQ